MSPHPELSKEQAHIDLAYQRVDELKEAARSAMNEVLDLGKGGTFQARTERDVVVRTSLARLEQLDIGDQPLCFGRIDEIEGDHFHIGRMGVSGSDQEPLIVDWRAPVAEPFYRATGRVPMGLARRRHFQVKGRTVTAIEDELLVISENNDLVITGQGALLAALERSRSGRMQDIIATIQGEQDEIIRSELAGVLVTQGGPGTGKTAVALHRAAYLLYTFRFPLERQGVLVVGPNPIFLRYISHVLPSLGETGVSLSTISGLVADAKPSGHDSPAAAAIKGDPRMVRVILRAVRQRQRALRADAEIAFGPYFLTFSAEESRRIVDHMKNRSGSHNARRRRVESMVAESLYKQYETALERARLIDPSLRKMAQADFSVAIIRDAAVVKVLNRIWPRLEPTELIHDLFGAEPLLVQACKNIFSSQENAVELLKRSRSNSLEEIPWTASDIALIDEARVLLGAFRPLGPDEQLIPAFGHVIVDEAQDLSPMQVRMLARRCIGGSMTIVGDIAQASGPFAPTSWDDILTHLPKNWNKRLVELTIGYRTPAEAMKLAESVLKQTGLNLTPPRPVRSSGVEPQIINVDSTNHMNEELLSIVKKDADTGLVAVICPYKLLSSVFDYLSENEVEVGTASTRVLDTQVSVLTAREAKGLEFDSVVVIEPSDIIKESKHGLRALYVALTRTTSNLAIIHNNNLPEFLNI